jgi:hypothetical protein
VVAALFLAGVASASGSWAGLTRTQAIGRAKAGVLTLVVQIDGYTPAQVARFRHQLDKASVTATHATCKNGRHVWKVLFGKQTAKNDPVYIDSKRIELACR